MKNINKLRRSIILLSIFLVATLALCYGLFRLIKNNAEKTSLLSSEAEEQSLYEQHSHDLKNLIQDIDPQIQELSSRVVASEGTVDFINSVESLAQSTGLEIAIQNVAETPAPSNSPAYDLLGLTISTTGSWAGSYKFVELFQTMPYDVAISQLSFTETGASGGDASSTPGIATWTTSISFTVLKHK